MLQFEVSSDRGDTLYKLHHQRLPDWELIHLGEKPVAAPLGAILAVVRQKPTVVIDAHGTFIKEHSDIKDCDGK